MITALSLARTYSARLALGVLQNSQSSSSGSESSSPAARLLGAHGLDAGDSTGLDSKTVAILLQAIQNRSNSGNSGPATQVGVLGSKNFMSSLKDRLSTTGTDPISFINHQEMSKAFKDGTLKVTNPATGETVTAYDPSDGKTHDTSADTKDPTAWNKFLQDHLKRDANGSFAKSADGSFIDAKTGEKASFERIGSTNYYFTWPGEMSANV